MTYFGRIWLTDGQILDFKWTVEFYVARAFYERKGRVKRAIHTVWGPPLHFSWPRNK